MRFQSPPPTGWPLVIASLARSPIRRDNPPMASALYFTAVQADPGWQAVLEAFARFVALPPAQRVLDVGCGPGQLPRLLAAAGHTVTGLDRDPAMVAQAAAQAAGPTYLVGDVLTLPFAPASFDAVLATNVVFLTTDPARALREMARLVRLGGLVAMLNPSEAMSIAAATALANERDLTGFPRTSLINWGRIAEANHRFTPADLTTLYQQAGLATPTTADKLGPGLARFVKARK